MNYYFNSRVTFEYNEHDAFISTLFFFFPRMLSRSRSAFTYDKLPIRSLSCSNHLVDGTRGIVVESSVVFPQAIDIIVHCFLINYL